MNNSEIKVGILVIVAIAAFTWLTFKSGGINGGATSENYTRYLASNFDDVDGLILGAKVRVAGVEVGDVTDITLSKTGTATVHMYVDKDIILPENILAQVASSGIIGEKFVSLATDFDPTGVLQKETNKIPSKKSASVEDMAENFARISSDLEQVTASLRSALGGQENSAKISKIVDGFATFSESLGADGGDIVKDLKAATNSLKNILEGDGENSENILENISLAAKNIATITDKIDKGEGTLGRLLSSESTAMEDLDSAMADLKQITAKINNGKGTIGRLLNDDAIIDKVDEALDGFTEMSNRINSFHTEIDFYGYSLLAEDVGKGRFELTLQPRPTRYYVIGVAGDGFATESTDARSNLSFNGEDFGNELKYTFQFGHVYQDAMFNKDIGFRIGVKDSTFGIGFDTAFWGNFVDVSADLYDLTGENSGTSEENMHLDFTAKVNLIDNTLYAVGGYDNALSSKYGSPYIGLGFRFVDDDFKYLFGQAL